MTRNVKYVYKGKPVRQMLNGNDYILFQYRIKDGMSCSAAVENVLRERRKIDAERRMRFSLMKANAASHQTNEDADRAARAAAAFFKDGVARLERAYRRQSGHDFPPDVPRPANSPHSLDDMYLITRYGRIKMALEALKHG